MKVVHVTASLVKKSAGVREVVLGLASAQASAGADVSVLGLDHPDWSAEEDDWHDLDTHVVPVVGPRRFGYAPKMCSALRELGPDIVHLHGLWMHPGRSVLQWHHSTSGAYIVSPHGMLSDVALTFGRFKKRLVSFWFQESVFLNAAAVHATSDGEMSEIRNHGIEVPIFVVPNGISAPASSLGVAEPGRTILSLGRIHPKKGLHLLVRAWAGLAADFPDWSVQIVGPDEGGETSRLRALIADHSVPRISVSGPIFGAAKTALMRQAGIFALPTLSENFALTVAESLVLEVPVVASHGAPWSGLETEGCGYWVPVGSESMAEGLRKMMSLDDDERRRMGQRGRAWMQRDYSWRAISDQVLGNYKDILDRTQ